ncbi:MAG: tRNA (N(6)-L-threonylcarbamoyladenosine(37)-C(2))-methylthiotransferase MtaB [Dysosmobacter sp.]|nr:tRNA (N(6)-L-threonylcarbamoyladenosine(37)-C(2))-methylthiotransferase MtaB [Dysosmobacter sp.]
MKVAIYTLGCKVNQYETQAMEQSLRSRGHEIVDFSDAADAYVVNTCSVTAVSDQKSRQIIHRAKKQHPEAVVAVCGCYSQTHAEEVGRLEVDLIAGTGDRTGFLDLLEQAVGEKRHIEAIDQSFERRVFEVLPAGGMASRTRAMLKVEDGCVNFCTYCIIPYARGPVRSAPLETAVTQAAQLAAEGYREIVLTGIEISSWGRDLKNGKSLIDLLEAICAAVPGVRVRLGSLEPRTITEEFCRRAAALPNLCPQFHLSMQSGCDATLKRMNRKYDTARFYESVELLNRFFDRPAVTTDLITGFPEETEEEFAQTLDFIRRCGFAQMHIFPYSVRPGTPAAKMRQNPKAVKEERAHRAAAVAAEMHRAYLEGCVGRVYPVLFEQPKNGRFSGHAPNYMEVLADGENLHNIVQNVQIIGIDGDALLGELLEEGDGTPV